MKKRNWIVILSFAFFLLLSGRADASGLQSGKSIIVKEGEIVSGNLYASGDEIIIDGTVAGDLIGAAEKITVNGSIGGDLIGIAQQIEVNGQVEGSARIAAEKISISGKIKKNADLLGEKIEFGSDSFIGWDVLAFGNEIYLNGIIEGRADLDGQTVGINSQVKKDAKIRLEGKKQSLLLNPATKIDGDLQVSSDSGAFISNEAEVNGSTTPIIRTEGKTSVFSWLLFRLLAIAAALLAAFAFHFGLKRHSQGIIKKISKDPLRASLSGLLFLAAAPVAIIICAVTIIGLPLALVSSAAYLVIIYAGKVFAAMFAGQSILNGLFKKKGGNAWAIIIGISACWLIFAIPYFGLACSFAAAAAGAGGIIKYVKD